MNQPESLSTMEMHTAGDPFRLIVSGFPLLEGATIKDKQRHCEQHYDHLRRAVMQEPRGHDRLWGGLLVKPDHPEANIAALFLNKNGYAPMCGVGIICIAKYAVDHGFVEPTVPETTVCIQIPAGLVWTRVEWDGTKTGATVLQTVPVFTEKLSYAVYVEEIGHVDVDISNGVFWFAFVRDKQLGIDIGTAPAKKVIELGMKVKDVLNEVFKPPLSDDPCLQDIISVIITDGGLSGARKNRVHMVYGDAQLARSPGGSACSAHVASLYSKGKLVLGQWQVFESASTGSEFLGRALRSVKEGGHSYDAVVAEIKGRSFYTGQATYTMDTEDNLRHGFLL